MEAQDSPKVMRKGTRACAECRRRKLKCIYPIDFSPCTECTDHKRQCVSQGVVIPAAGSPRRHQKLRVRVSRLETMIERLSQPQADLRGTNEGVVSPPTPAQPHADNTSILKDHRYTLEDLQELDATSQMRSPLSALLNNDTVSSHCHESMNIPTHPFQALVQVQNVTDSIP